MRYLVQPRDQIFVKGYGFFSFSKNMGKNIGKSISKNISGKCSQKLLDHAKQSGTDALKTSSKRVIQIAAEATSDLNYKRNRITKMTKVSRRSPQNNSQTITNEHDKEIPKERYISPEERQKITDDLRLI